MNRSVLERFTDLWFSIVTLHWPILGSFNNTDASILPSRDSNFIALGCGFGSNLLKLPTLLKYSQVKNCHYMLLELFSCFGPGTLERATVREEGYNLWTLHSS